jgi:hypothetical protein
MKDHKFSVGSGVVPVTRSLVDEKWVLSSSGSTRKGLGTLGIGLSILCMIFQASFGFLDENARW